MPGQPTCEVGFRHQAVQLAAGADERPLGALQPHAAHAQLQAKRLREAVERQVDVLL